MVETNRSCARGERRRTTTATEIASLVSLLVAPVALGNGIFSSV